MERTDSITIAVGEYIKHKGIKISTLAERTGISDKKLYASLCPPSPTKTARKLRADELVLICAFLELDPMQFLQTEKPTD